MSAAVLILSVLAAFAGAAVGAAWTAVRLKPRDDWFAKVSRRLDDPPNDAVIAQLLRQVDGRLSEFSRIARADCLMTSPAERLRSVTGRWHQYNVTVKHGASTWIHVEYEIKATATGALEFSVEYDDNQGGTADYLYEGVLRDDRVVLIGRPAAGGQPCFVEIWPHLANKALRNHFGICLNQSWDQQETVIPCIMTRTRLEKDDDEVLDALWIAQLQSPTGLNVFPRLRGRLGDP